MVTAPLQPVEVEIVTRDPFADPFGMGPIDSVTLARPVILDAGPAGSFQTPPQIAGPAVDCSRLATSAARAVFVPANP